MKFKHAIPLLIGCFASTYGAVLLMQSVDILGAALFLSGVILILTITGAALENNDEDNGAGVIEFKASDETVQKYEILGKIIQENAEGLAALEEEKPAEKKRAGDKQ